MAEISNVGSNIAEKSTVIWNVADMLNACMIIPNLVALLGLSGVIASETKKYVWDKDAEWGGLMKWMDDVAPQLDK